VEYSVTLKAVPSGIAIPPRLTEKAILDPASRRFVYRGFMTKLAYDELAEVSDDPEYRRALEQLFVLTAQGTVPAAALRQRTMTVVIAGLCTAIALVVIFWVMSRQASAAKPTNIPSQVTVNQSSH
jgi:hypothetical protein